VTTPTISGRHYGGRSRRRAGVHAILSITADHPNPDRLEVKRTSLQGLARELDVDVETARAGLATLLRAADFTADCDPEQTQDDEDFEITAGWETFARTRIAIGLADPPDHAQQG
jgi:hypothetical protein